MIGDSAATLYITLYLRFFSDANTMVWVGFAFNIIAIIGCFYLTESPSWLVSVGRKQEAKRILERIAKINGVKDFHIADLKKTEMVYE